MTTQLNRILAATDLSAPARQAAERAALVSKETAARLELVHVANLAPLERLRQLMTGVPDDLQERVLGTARARLDELAATLLKDHGVAAETRVLAGSLLAELGREANVMAAGLLVCGAKGESVVRHLLLGSTAERMLGSSVCPVLVVKQAPLGSYRHVLIPVDFSPSSLQAIRNAQAIAPGAGIVLLHAFEAPFEGHLRYASVDDGTIDRYRVVAQEDATRKLQALGGQAGLSPHGARLLVLHGDPSLRILEQEQEQDCDLVVIGKHGQSLLERWLLGSVTRHVLAQSRGDVLVSV